MSGETEAKTHWAGRRANKRLPCYEKEKIKQGKKDRDRDRVACAGAGWGRSSPGGYHVNLFFELVERESWPEAAMTPESCCVRVVGSNGMINNS